MMYMRKLNNEVNAGITTYVIIMFGMAFMLYLFGFTSMFGSYTGTTTEPISGGANVTNETGENKDIVDPNMNQGTDFIQMIISPISALAMGGALIGGFLIFRFLGASTVYFQFVIPAVILMALNIFVFPIQDISNHTSMFAVNGISIVSIFLIAFFNLFYILAVVEFIRGVPS